MLIDKPKSSSSVKSTKKELRNNIKDFKQKYNDPKINDLLENLYSHTDDVYEIILNNSRAKQNKVDMDELPGLFAKIQSKIDY